MAINQSLMIRKYITEDLEQLISLWLQSYIEAHSFIDAKYWESNMKYMYEVLPKATIWVYVENQVILGFIGLVDSYIAGLFVYSSCRSSGIGRQLLLEVKRVHKTLSLAVYKRNVRASQFYLREGFNIESERVDEATGELELYMRWKKEVDLLACLK